MIQGFKQNFYHSLQNKYPFVYIILRFCYQVPFVIFSKFKKNIYVNCKRVTDLGKEHLFGYYDKPPWDFSGQSMIFLQVPFTNHHPSIHDKAVIKLANLESGETISLATTRAWNLQQGCRLQWLGPDFQKRIIYNDFRNGIFISVIKEIQTGNEQIVEKPIYDVANDGKSALTLNFERLHLFRPGYGYQQDSSEQLHDLFPLDDGIWSINLKEKKRKLIISVFDIAKETMHFGQNISSTRINHIMINPSGTRFMFLYRWKKENVDYTRLYTANMDGSDLICLVKNGIVSHATWKNNEELLVWTRHKSSNGHFYLFRDKSDHFKIVGKGILVEDGHPSYSSCGRYILTDTYSNRARQRRVLICDTQKEEVFCMGAFYTPFQYHGQTRCDLHPRWKNDNTQICIDSAYEGSRQIYILDNPLSNNSMKKNKSYG